MSGAIQPGIFKAYDVRGTYPDQIDEAAAYAIGRAFCLFTGEPKVVVGRDVRLHSPALAAAFIKGANDQGVDVVDIGLCSTDMIYFASGVLDLPGTVVTASHNPKEYNGMKFCRRKAAPISEDTGLREIRDLAMAGDFPSAERRGGVEHRDMMPQYVEHVLSFIDPSVLKPWRVVVDAGNGIAGMLIPPVFERLTCEVIPLFFELDGSFPHHQPSPIEPENIRIVQDAVLEHGADLGVAFDGDADRVFLVDDKGEPVSGSLTTAMVAERMLQKNPGSKVIYNLINSWVVPEVIEQYGGIPIRERVGHSFIKQTMAETGALFGGEHSGHYYFRDNYRADSGLIATLIVLELISVEDKPLSEILRPFRKYAASGEINSQVADKDAKIRELAERYSSGKQDFLDGITIEFDDWWFNVRPSNTEPLLRLNLEAKTPELMEARRDEVLAVIRS
jgi:phosphomannomutase